MRFDYHFRETNLFGVIAQASATTPKVDLTVVIVAVVGMFSAIAVAYFQYGKRANAEGEAKSAKKVEEKATVSESAMAHVAERSLSLLESMLESEKTENAALSQLLQAAQDKLVEKNATIEELRALLQTRESTIRELEYELHRLRGHLDSLLGKKGPTNVLSSEG